MPQKTQIQTTPQLKKLVENMQIPATFEQLIKIKDLMYAKLTIRPYNHFSAPQERAIRWRRTADQILNDGYVYQGKACTDLTVLFIALCKAVGLKTNFVKVTKEKKVHSVAEIRLGDDWYIFDVSSMDNIPVKGLITKDSPYRGWQLWQKGRDAWNLGLTDYESILKVIT